MSTTMLEQISPPKLANRGQTIEIHKNVDFFPRLVEIVENALDGQESADIGVEWQQAPLDIKLRFGWADDLPGVPAAEGSVEVTLPAICQRCLEPFEMVLHAPVKMLFVAPDVEVAESGEYEIWEMEGSDLRLADVVEEVLVMAMPFSTVHPSIDDCTGVVVVDAKHGDKKAQPFADLKSMMANAEEKN